MRAHVCGLLVELFGEQRRGNRQPTPSLFPGPAALSNYMPEPPAELDQQVAELDELVADPHGEGGEEIEEHARDDSHVGSVGEAVARIEG